ncbi:hypothetical protein M7I_6599 [Glarea lozoyensis 74030]|uniref:Uncharacterized protein n=1 Tax=Glarea lozoyensis (strain ATCC 74030 / MF5533) TaxID=1104152 RepID=H0EV07_GLAL7|nr:hypothetical protein M7I_6599 [Glarea lozoyensis 74030]
MESHAARGAPNPQRVAGSVVQDDLIMGRRAPLINRGYWLRMKAIDNVLKL